MSSVGPERKDRPSIQNIKIRFGQATSVQSRQSLKNQTVSVKTDSFRLGLVCGVCLIFVDNKQQTVKRFKNS